jgi:hypothetical protein
VPRGGAGCALLRYAPAPLSHPIGATLAFLALYVLVLYVLEGKQIADEARALLAAVRGKKN